MKRNDPFEGSYTERLSKHSLIIDYKAEGECGMGGPTQGILSLSDIGEFHQAHPPVKISDLENKLAFITWFYQDGGAKSKIHILNLETKNIIDFEIKFGAYSFITFNDNQITILDTNNKKTTKINIEQF